MEAEDGYWLTFECKPLAALRKNRLRQPLSTAGLAPSEGQESQALALIFPKVSVLKCRWWRSLVEKNEILP